MFALVLHNIFKFFEGNNKVKMNSGLTMSTYERRRLREVCLNCSVLRSHINAPFILLPILPKTFVCNFIVKLTELLFHPPESCHSEKATSSR